MDVIADEFLFQEHSDTKPCWKTAACIRMSKLRVNFRIDLNFQAKSYSSHHGTWTPHTHTRVAVLAFPDYSTCGLSSQAVYCMPSQTVTPHPRHVCDSWCKTNGWKGATWKISLLFGPERVTDVPLRGEKEQNTSPVSAFESDIKTHHFVRTFIWPKTAFYWL